MLQDDNKIVVGNLWFTYEYVVYSFFLSTVPFPVFYRSLSHLWQPGWLDRVLEGWMSKFIDWKYDCEFFDGYTSYCVAEVWHNPIHDHHIDGLAQDCGNSSMEQTNAL